MTQRDFFFVTTFLAFVALLRGYHWLDVAAVLSLWWAGAGFAGLVELVLRDAE